jgi:hypothetical protein
MSALRVLITGEEIYAKPAEHVRDRVQDMVHDEAVERGGAF